MAGQIKVAETARDRFMEAAQKELVAAELRERQFKQKERQERAAELRLPVRIDVTN